MENKCERKLEEQEKKHIEQMDKLKRELNEGMKILARTRPQPEEVVTIAEAEEPTYTTSTTQNREMEDSSTSDVQKRTPEEEYRFQKRDDNSPLIVIVNHENVHRVSREHHGMLRNHNGTYARTPQYETWCKNNILQLKNEYESVPVMPEELKTTPGHPLPTNLKQIWSFGGEWVMAPSNTSDQGPYINEFRAARIEPIIELDGSIKKILSYGSEAEKLTTWFMLEDIQKLYPDWKIPQPPKFFNGKKFNMRTLRESSASKTNTREGRNGGRFHGYNR